LIIKQARSSDIAVATRPKG